MQTSRAPQVTLTPCGKGAQDRPECPGVICAGQFLIMELEMIESFLHLGAQPAAAERPAQNLAERPAASRLRPDIVDTPTMTPPA
jgi:hypothetical protein